ncbi:MAG TPA: protein kinase [Gemmatimonadales bacterium]
MSDLGSRHLAAALADRYRLERELGQGGMATVYLAHDLRHDRDVAIKVLHPELAAALGGERFLSEIKTTAKLQHPHILPLLDSGAAEGLLYYVMPYVSGETLRARLERERQLPLDDALRITREVADALGAAHALGIIHRDIKPENILLQGGHALVADFGIALAVQQAGGARMTQTGLSLGTPQYMAPEQAMGERKIDARADVYALGAVLYEMLTGDPPFTGSTVQAIVAKVMTERPVPPSTVRDTVPPQVEQAILTSLAKLPADRFSSAAEFTRGLTAASGQPRVASSPTRRRAARLAPWFLAAALAVALGGVLASRPAGPSRAPEVIRFPLGTGAAVLAKSGSTNPFAISPDGRAVVFRAPGGADSPDKLWLRTLDDPRPRVLEGTDNGQNPSFSPDGKWIAFVVANRKLMKIPTSGGSASTVCALEYVSASLSWASEAEIVFESFGRQGLQRVSASGGTPRAAVSLDTANGEIMQRRPLVLRREGVVLFASSDRDGRTQLAAAPLEGGRATRLGVDGIHPLGMIDGWLIYARVDGALMAVAFDPGRLQVSGAPVQLVDRVASTFGGVAVALSPNGTLVYEPGAIESRLTLVDSSGRSTTVLDEERPYRGPRFSPDARHLAVGIGDARGLDVWLFERATSAFRRLTLAGNASAPEWSPDGHRLFYTVGSAGGRRELWSVPIDGSAEPSRLLDLPGSVMEAVPTPDGKSLVVRRVDPAKGSELLHVSLVGDATPRLLATSPNPRGPRVSPDGRWVAYVAAQEISQVYVRPLLGAGEVQVSVNGGVQPIWAPNSRRLYFRSFVGRLTEVELGTSPVLQVVRRRPMLEDPSQQIGPTADYDLSPDGTTFVMLAPPLEKPGIVVALDWAADVRRRLRSP